MVAEIKHGGLLEFRAYEIVSETIIGSIRCFLDARRQFHMHEYLIFLPIASYSIAFSFPLSRKPHPSETNRLLGRTESCWKEDLKSSFTLAAHSHLEHVTCVLWGLAWASTEQWC